MLILTSRIGYILFRKATIRSTKLGDAMVNNDWLVLELAVNGF